MRRFIFFAIAFLGLFVAYKTKASMPVTSFIIEPENFKEDIYSQPTSKFIISSSEDEFSLPETPNQKIIGQSQKQKRKEIILQTGKFLLEDNSSKEKYLKNTPFLNLDSKEISLAAKKFEKSKDPIKDISFFVYEHISDKKEGIPLIPALSILKGKAGDCTEHAVLTIALLRANKIPARAVMGVILSQEFLGKKNIFVYHMWAEAFIKGKWIIVDSTRPWSINYNRYIAFAYHNLTTESPLEYLNGISYITNVKIKIID